MRFYWGLGVGHVYSHGLSNLVNQDQDNENVQAESQEEEEEILMNEEEHREEEDEDNYFKDFGMENRENDRWMDEDSDPNEGDEGGTDDDDDEFLEKYSMYGL